MARWSSWAGVGAAAGIISALVPVVRGSISLEPPLVSLHKAAQTNSIPKVDLSELDLTRLDLRPRRVLAPVGDGKVAELTLDPIVQRAAQGQMKRYRVPEAGVVMMEARTGNVLAYASHVNEGKRFDVNSRAEAPAASVFKVVTGAALVEKAGLSAKTEQCYRGGKSRILADELRDDPRRDKWCATLAEAMGRSLNVVFGRLAQKHLTPEDLTETGGAFGFGAPVPFAVPNQAPAIEIPGDPLEFARTAAGFWNTTLSPLAAASLAQTIANQGVTLQPRIVVSVLDGDKPLWKDDRGAVMLRRAIKPSTAAQLTQMMMETTSNGSAFKSFHDAKGTPFLPGIPVAGKTGSLTRHETNKHYSWFIGFAPADQPEVTIAALVVNTPAWKIKAPEMARNVLRAYFAARDRPGVTPP